MTWSVLLPALLRPIVARMLGPVDDDADMPLAAAPPAPAVSFAAATTVAQLDMKEKHIVGGIVGIVGLAWLPVLRIIRIILY